MAGLNPLYPAPDKWRPGDNLLDNWYFAGGGSQLGWGHFPINQRGLTEYETPGGYAVDRWKFSGALITAKVDTEYITLRNNHQHRRGLTQFVDTGVASALKGRTVTVSALAKGTLQFAVGYTDTLAASASSDVFTSEDFELVNWTIENAPIESGLSVWLLLSQGQECSVIAAKLELGDQQTLAHKEGGKWVVNRVPDFREELAKCQAYQLKTPNGGSLFASVGIGTVISETTAQILIPTPVSMRTLPFATITGKWFLRGGGKIVTFNAGEAGVRVTATQYSENAITLEITGLTGLPVNYAMELMRNNDATAQILLDDN